VSLWVARPWVCLATQPLGTILDSSPCVSPDKPQAQDDSALAANILTPICQNGTRRDTNGHHNDARWCYGQAMARRGVSRRFLRAERPKNRGRVTKPALEPFCDFRRLWYTPTYKLSALQGWRHGVRSRSLGGIPVTNNRVRTCEI
jgi:hypothetical protein